MESKTIIDNKIATTTDGLMENSRCELVSGKDVSRLEGKIKTVIDSLGLPDKQEKATKDILQTVLWDWFNFITDYRTDHLFEKEKWYQREHAETGSGEQTA